MPLYEIHHSHALTESQRAELAGAITRLHATTFATPSIFVHVRFIHEDPSDGNYFIAGTPRHTSLNSIIAHVRTSPARTKADFDQLAQRIEDAWYHALGVAPASSDELVPSGAGEKKLIAVAFFPLLTARELGLTIPEAGKEVEWFKEQLPLIKNTAHSQGGDFAHMLNEFKEREDLRKLLA
ncbi:Tautomerase, partial [Metarhizium majus ARSEF 297]